MSRIGSWNKIVDRQAKTAKQSGLLSMTVKEWQNEHTGETISIVFQRAETEGYNDFYEILYNGESVTAEDTISRAYDSVVDTMKHFPQGGL